jgi:integrase
MAKLSLAALFDPKPGTNFVDPSVEGLRYRVRGSGRTYAELRWKSPQGWRAEPLGRLNVEERLGDILDGVEGITPGLEDVLEPIRRQARKLRQQLRAGQDPRGTDTLGAAVESFLRHARAKPHTLVDRERYLRSDWEPLHRRPLKDITRKEVAARLLQLRAEKAGARGGGVAVVNRSRGALSTLFRWGIRHGLCDMNPVELTEIVPEPSRKRVLSLDELRRIWAATDGSNGLPSAYAGIVRTLMLTGARRSEVGGMLWAEVDLDEATWQLPAERSKNGEANSIPLSEAAVDLMLGTAYRGDFVFGGRKPYATWAHTKVALDRHSGVANWCVHDVRRSVATHLAEELGVEDRVIDAILNHVHRSKVTRTYIRAPHSAAKRAALESWAEFLLG